MNPGEKYNWKAYLNYIFRLRTINTIQCFSDIWDILKKHNITESIILLYDGLIGGYYIILSDDSLFWSKHGTLDKNRAEIILIIFVNYVIHIIYCI